MKKLLSSNTSFHPKLTVKDSLLYASMDIADVTRVPGANLAAVEVSRSLSQKGTEHTPPEVELVDRGRMTKPFIPRTLLPSFRDGQMLFEVLVNGGSLTSASSGHCPCQVPGMPLWVQSEKDLDLLLQLTEQQNVDGRLIGFLEQLKPAPLVPAVSEAPKVEEEHHDSRWAGALLPICYRDGNLPAVKPFPLRSLNLLPTSLNLTTAFPPPQVQQHHRLLRRVAVQHPGHQDGAGHGAPWKVSPARASFDLTYLI